MVLPVVLEITQVVDSISGSVVPLAMFKLMKDDSEERRKSSGEELFQSDELSRGAF